MNCGKACLRIRQSLLSSAYPKKWTVAKLWQAVFSIFFVVLTQKNELWQSRVVNVNMQVM